MLSWVTEFDYFRFLKVPPGFTHEMKYHLTELKPVIDPLTGAPIIDAENYCCGEYSRL